MEQACFDDLPYMVKMHIASMLDYKDLSRCCQVSQDLQDVCSCDALWKPLCLKFWNSDGSVGGSRQGFFRQMYLTKGRYIGLYQRVADVWSRIKKHLASINPSIPATLNEGISEDEMDEFEAFLKFPLPNDLRCLLSFHNGQEATYQDGLNRTCPSWFFGKLKSYDYENFFTFVPFRPIFMRHKCFVLLAGSEDGHCLACYLCDLRHQQQQPPSSVDHPKLEPGNIVAFASTSHSSYYLEAKSSLDLFSSFADHLDQRKMPIHDGLLYRFWGDASNECTTRSVRIRVYTSYVFALSSRRCHVFAYLVEFKMDRGAREEEACKLETRMWEVESQKGGTNRVEGEGVIGEYPIFKPGTHYTYISCTNVFDSAASMRGHYTVRNLATNSRYRLQIPEFHMEIPDLKDDL